jgi:hypothetical protein
MANANPIYDPAHGLTGVATGAAVVGSRLLKVAAAKVDGGNIPVAHAGASDPVIGVAAADALQNGLVTIYPIQVLRVESAGTIAAGVAVEVTTAGKIIAFSTGQKVGVTLEAATNGTFPLVLLQL